MILLFPTFSLFSPCPDKSGPINFRRTVVGWLSFGRLPLPVFSFGYLSYRMPGSSLLFRIRNRSVPVVTNIYFAASCPEGRIRPVQSVTGMKNFQSLLCSWSLWFFNPFRLPAHSYRCMKVVRIYRYRYFRAFPFRGTLNSRIRWPNWQRLTGSGIAAFSLSFPILSNCLFTSVVSVSNRALTGLLPALSQLFPCPDKSGLTQFGAVAISLVAFPISPLLLISSGFPC